MVEPLSYKARFTEGPRYYAGGLWRLVNEKQIFLWAQAIAFKVLIAVVPVIVLAVAIFSQVLRREKPFEVVAGFITSFLPAYRSSDVIRILNDLQSASGALTIVGLATLVFFAMTLFTTLRVVIENVFQEDWHETRSILGGYLFDLRMAAQVGLVFLLTFALTLGMQAMNAAGYEFIEEIGLGYEWVRQGWGRLFTYFGIVLPFLLSVGMFWQLLFFIPKPHPPKRSALIGALVTALLWELAKFAFTLYATRLGRFERYRPSVTGEEVNAAAILGDTFGLILAFVFWVYYSGIVLCIGGMVALLHEKRFRTRRKLRFASEMQGQAEPGNGQAAEAEGAAPAPPKAQEEPQENVPVK